MQTLVKTSAFLQKHLLTLGILLVPCSLFFTTGATEALFLPFFYIAPILLLPFVLKKKSTFSKPFLIITGLILLENLIQIPVGFFGVSLGVTIIAIMQNLCILAWMIVFYLHIQNTTFSSISKQKHTSNLAMSSQIPSLLLNLLTAIGIILSLLSFYYLIPWVPKPATDINLFYAAAGHNLLSAFLLLILPYHLIKWLNSEQRGRANIIILIILLISFGLSLSRSAMLGLSIALMWLIRKFRQTSSKTTIIYTLIILPFIFTICLWLMASMPYTQSIIHSPNFENNWLLRQTIKPLDSEGRITYWKAGLKAFMHRPILGNGTGTFEIFYLRWRDRDIPTVFANSILVEKISEGGIVGTLLYLSVIVSVIFIIRNNFPNSTDQLKSKKLPKQDIAIYAITASIIAVVVQAFFDKNLNFISLKLMFWLFITMLAANIHRPIKSSSHPLNQICNFFIYLIFSVLLFFGILYTASFYWILQTYRRPVQMQAFMQKVVQIYPFEGKYWRKYLQSALSDKSNINDKTLESAVSFNRENSELYLDIANYSDKKQDISQKITHLQKNVMLNPVGNDQARIKLIKELYLNNQFLDSFDELSSITKTTISSNIQYYQSVNININALIDIQPSISDALTAYSSSSEIKQLMKTNNSTSKVQNLLAKIHYLIGYNALQLGDNATTLIYWTNAVNLAPEWSYFHLELANLYQSHADQTTYNAQLKFCQQFNYPQDDCKQKLQNPIIENPGLYLEKITREVI